jgi:hypothetical protein
MPFTYTYSARNKDNPNRMVTFTIYDEQLKVNLSGLVEQVSEVFNEEDRKSAIKEVISTQSGTALYKAIERLSGPVHINDVTPIFKNGEFTLTFWNRVIGLRFAPIVIMMGDVDNPAAAEQFIKTLEERQDLADNPGFFAGPLDYWATWIGAVIALIVLLRWPHKKKPQQTES